MLIGLNLKGYTAYLSIYTLFDCTPQATYTLLASLYYENEKVDRVRVATRMGGESEVVYITESGREIRAELIAGLNQ